MTISIYIKVNLKNGANICVLTLSRPLINSGETTYKRNILFLYFLFCSMLQCLHVVQYSSDFSFQLNMDSVCPSLKIAVIIEADHVIALCTYMTGGCYHISITSYFRF